MTQPRLLVFEGVDGAGKTTLSRLLTEQLVAQGRQVREFSFPGSTPGTLGALVYRFHHDSAALGVKQVHPAALQLMHVAAHVDTIIRAIGPTLDEGLDVTLDRFWWSTWAYGVADGLPEVMARAILKPELAAWRSVVPSALFLIERRQPTVAPRTKRIMSEYRRLQDAHRQHYPVFVISNDDGVDDAMVQIHHALDIVFGGA